MQSAGIASSLPNPFFAFLRIASRFTPLLEAPYGVETACSVNVAWASHKRLPRVAPPNALREDHSDHWIKFFSLPGGNGLNLSGLQSAKVAKDFVVSRISGLVGDDCVGGLTIRGHCQSQGHGAIVRHRRRSNELNSGSGLGFDARRNSQWRRRCRDTERKHRKKHSIVTGTKPRFQRVHDYTSKRLLQWAGPRWPAR